MNGNLYENRYKLFTVGAIGTFMATLDGSILNVALPTIASDLQCSINTVAWVVLSYSLTLISLMLIFGVWVKQKGYFFGYRFGYIFFIVGSIVCAMSSSIYLLVAGRIVQAIGTAMFAAIGPGMVTHVFGDKERGKGIGMMVMMVMAGFMVGPPLGGLLLSYFPWQSIFIINVPIGLLGFYLTYRYFQTIDKSTDGKSLHLQSAIAMSLSMVILTVCISLIKDYPLSDIRIWGGVLLAFVAMVMFFRYEKDPHKAMIGLDIFKNRQFTSSLIAMIFMFVSNAGILILIPFYLENVMNYQPDKVGLFLIILPLMMFILAPLSGRVSDKIGYRLLTVTGLIILIGGYYMLSNLSWDSTAIQIVTALVVVGMGVGIFNTPNSSAFMGSVGKEHVAVASSILATSRNIGMSFGVAVGTSIFAYSQNYYSYLDMDNQIFVNAYQVVIYVAMGTALVALGASAVRGRVNKAQ